MNGIPSDWIYLYLAATATHEYFHKIQFEYVTWPDPDFTDWILEGTATWAEDAVDDNTNDYVNYFGYWGNFHFMDEPDQTLMDLSYEASLYFKFLTEWQGLITLEPVVGIDLMLALWEEWDSVFSNGTIAITNVLESWVSLNFEISFREWTLANYLKDFGNPYPAYDYIEDEDCYYFGGNCYPDNSVFPENLSPDQNYFYLEESIYSWASDYFEYDVNPNVDSIYIDCETLSGDVFWQVMPVRDSTAVMVYESGNANYDLELYNLYISATGEGNSPPALADGSVSPDSGNLATIFIYNVTYSDPDGDIPAGNYLFIDDNPFEMNYISGNFTTGALYRYETTLSFGIHNYNFIFNDGFGHEIRLPQSGYFNGPNVGLGGNIFNVPSEYITIQAGIDAAEYGDIVIVADGTYTGVGNKNIDFLGKTITVMSENGAENCIIDCENDARGIYFHCNESNESVLEGFTIIVTL